MHGFSYDSAVEAAQKIEILLKDEKLRADVSTRASGRAMEFDSSVIERNILNVVNRVCSQKLQ